MNEDLQNLGKYLAWNIISPNVEEQITLIMGVDSPHIKGNLFTAVCIFNPRLDWQVENFVDLKFCLTWQNENDVILSHQDIHGESISG